MYKYSIHSLYLLYNSCISLFELARVLQDRPQHILQAGGGAHGGGEGGENEEVRQGEQEVDKGVRYAPEVRRQQSLPSRRQNSFR